MFSYSLCVFGLAAGCSLGGKWLGGFSPARGILLSIYMAILMVSPGLFWIEEPIAVTSLLLVQVIYKVTTLLTVGFFSNPVMTSNLLVASRYVVTLFLIFRELHNEPYPLGASE